jgi:hypothetical protein
LAIGSKSGHRRGPGEPATEYTRSHFPSLRRLSQAWRRTLGGPFGYRFEAQDPYRTWYQAGFLLLQAGIFGTVGWGKRTYRIWSLGERIQLTVSRNWISLVFWPWIWIHEWLHIWAIRERRPITEILILPWLFHLALASLVLAGNPIALFVGLQNASLALFTLPGDLLEALGHEVLEYQQRRAFKVLALLESQA